nr:hypothetical protein [Rhizobium ruizarguesonis]
MRLADSTSEHQEIFSIAGQFAYTEASEVEKVWTRRQQREVLVNEQFRHDGHAPDDRPSQAHEDSFADYCKALNVYSVFLRRQFSERRKKEIALEDCAQRPVPLKRKNLNANRLRFRIVQRQSCEDPTAFSVSDLWVDDLVWLRLATHPTMCTTEPYGRPVTLQGFKVEFVIRRSGNILDETVESDPSGQTKTVHVTRETLQSSPFVGHRPERRIGHRAT